MPVKSFVWERKKKQQKDGEIQLFQWSVSRLLCTQRYICEYFMNHQAVSFSLHAWFGVVASLAIIWVTHNYGKFKISVAIPKERSLPRSLILCSSRVVWIKIAVPLTNSMCLLQNCPQKLTMWVATKCMSLKSFTNDRLLEYLPPNCPLFLTKHSYACQESFPTHTHLDMLSNCNWGAQAQCWNNPDVFTVNTCSGWSSA